MLPTLLSVAIPLGFRHDSFWANVYFKGDCSCNFDNSAWIKLLHSIRNSNILSRWQFLLGICNTHWEVFLSKQVNYNQVVMKCQILQECFLQNFKWKKFKIWNIQIQGLFKDFQLPTLFSKALNFFPKFKDFQGLLKDPMNPVYKQCYNHPIWGSQYQVSVI